MKTENNILIAFLLNLSFSIMEFIGGIFTGSVAIISDAVHDIGDALSIGISYFLEKKSKKKPDDKYTYGYVRYSILGSFITTMILVAGSIIVIYNASLRLINPIQINYNGMILFAVFGTIVNFLAATFTKDGDSLNQRAVNLHMLEDVLGWIVVLIGAIIMRFTDISLIDPIMSIGVAIFVLIHALKNLKEVLDIFLEKTPENVNIDELKKHVMELDGVLDVHHIHVRSMDGYRNFATMHLVFDGELKTIKAKVKEELSEHGIDHSTIEFEGKDEACDENECEVKGECGDCNHHHHHHHHH